MSKPPKLSVVDGDGTPPEAAEEGYTYLPFFPDPNNPAECEEHIKRVFEAVVKHYGEDEARRIFGPYGRPRTKREINNEENEKLLTEYYLEGWNQKDKPNVHQLAVRLAKEQSVDPIALERKLWRLIKRKIEIKTGTPYDELQRLNMGLRLDSGTTLTPNPDILIQKLSYDIFHFHSW